MTADQRIDADRLDWIGELGYVKSRMDNVLGWMKYCGIREAIDSAREEEEAERIQVKQLRNMKGGTE